MGWLLLFEVMKSGNIVEYIDQQKIMCAVVLEVKKQRLRLLTETNREVNLSATRLSYRGEIGIDLSLGRDKLVENLKEIVSRRDALADCVDIKELWDILNTEQEWIDLATMTEFCFSDKPGQDHKSAVMRAFFKNRRYFKFNDDRFFPHSEEKVEQISAQAREAARRNRIIALGGDWIKKILKEYLEGPSKESLSEDEIEIIEILKSYYLFEKESRNHVLAKAMLSAAGIKDKEEILPLLVKLGIWHVDENIDLLKHEIPVSFSEEITAKVNELLQSFTVASTEPDRRDLTTLALMTIDGQFTLDFDDALSIEEK